MPYTVTIKSDINPFNETDAVHVWFEVTSDAGKVDLFSYGPSGSIWNSLGADNPITDPNRHHSEFTTDISVDQ